MIMKVVTIPHEGFYRATCCSPGWTMILSDRRCLEVALFDVRGPADDVRSSRKADSVIAHAEV